ncbi:MAG: hypothetical protein ACRCUY_12675 [Thermoguttaceae bacterium]
MSMSHHIALTWKNDGLALLVAKTERGHIVFQEAAFFSDVAPFTGNPPDSLLQFIQSHRIAGSDATVILGRSDMEVRAMFFPPVPTDELPDLVRFQAPREFNHYEAASPIDFFVTNKLDHVSRSTLFPVLSPEVVKLSQSAHAVGDSPKHVLAATIRENTFSYMEQFCGQLQLKLRHILLRPCVVASLWRRSPQFQPNQDSLLIEFDSHELSQVVLLQGEPVFMRSPKIVCPVHVNSPDFVAHLLSEIKRTQIAARNEIQGVAINEIVFCGGGTDFSELAQNVSKTISLPVKIFDPWQLVQCAPNLQKSLAANPERWGCLIGGIVQTTQEKVCEIDFCNPKKRPVSVGKRNLVTAVLACCFLLLAFLLGFGFYSQMTLTEDVRFLGNKLKTLKESAAILAEQRTQLNEIDKWLVDQVNWFDQLDWLSQRVPSAEEMVLKRLTLSANNRGSLSLEALLKNSSGVAPMDKNLRDELHELKTGPKGEDRSDPFYGFRYHLVIALSEEAAALVVPEKIPVESTQIPISPASSNPSPPENVSTSLQTGSVSAPLPDISRDNATPNDNSTENHVSSDNFNEPSRQESLVSDDELKMHEEDMLQERDRKSNTAEEVMQ